MILGIILVLGLILHIWIPSVFLPVWFLGPLLIYIFSRQYITIFIWIIIITYTLQAYTLTQWWKLGLYYFIWSLGVYIASLFLDRSWPVQSIWAVFWLGICNLLLYQFNVDYMNFAIYVIVNAVGIIGSLYLAEKLNLYEKYI